MPRARACSAGRLRLFFSGSALARMPSTVPSPPPVRRGSHDDGWRLDVDTGGRRRNWGCIDGTATQEQGAQGEPDEPSHDITSFSRAHSSLIGRIAGVHPFAGAFGSISGNLSQTAKPMRTR